MQRNLGMSLFKIVMILTCPNSSSLSSSTDWDQPVISFSVLSLSVIILSSPISTLIPGNSCINSAWSTLGHSCRRHSTFCSSFCWTLALMCLQMEAIFSSRISSFSSCSRARPVAPGNSRPGCSPSWMTVSGWCSAPNDERQYKYMYSTY